MNCTLTRIQSGPDGVFGILTNDTDNSQVAVTLEHAFADHGTFTPKIPAGVYTCHLYDSPHFGRKVWMLDNVPGHDHVEIHIGNFNKDSDGCILLGRRMIADPDDAGQSMITSSGNTFNKFMDLQNKVSEFQITVKDV